MRSSKDYNLEILIRRLQTLKRIWPHIDPRIHFLSIRELDPQNHIRVIMLRVIHTMNQRLI